MVSRWSRACGNFNYGELFSTDICQRCGHLYSEHGRMQTHINSVPNQKMHVLSAVDRSSYRAVERGANDQAALLRELRDQVDAERWAPAAATCRALARVYGQDAGPEASGASGQTGAFFGAFATGLVFLTGIVVLVAGCVATLRWLLN